MESRRSFFRKASLLGLGPFVPVDILRNVEKKDFMLQADAEPMKPLIAFPDNPDEWPAFRQQLATWRTNRQKQLNYDGAVYALPQFEWTQRNFSCYFLMMYDLQLYDPELRKYTVEKIIARGEEEFGGYDSVVLWHAYPRIGIDERNQYDFYRDMPGGLPGLKNLVAQFHEHGIKVFIAYYPWDQSTRRESKSDPEVVAEILGAINGDGIFLDTMKAAGSDFHRQLTAFREKGIALESELALEVEEISTHHLSWAQWFNDSFVPGVLRNKWFEPRHLQHQIARWNEDHSTELQMAWMNGSGMMVWENVFGQWMKWNARDRFTLKRMLPIQRHFWKIFSGNRWTPLVPARPYGVFASLWEAGDLRLWTLVNRNHHAVSGAVLEVDPVRQHVYYDLIRGETADVTVNKKTVVLSAEIPARSVYCFVSGTSKMVDADFQQLLANMKQLHTDSSPQQEEEVKAPERRSYQIPARQKDFDRSTMVEVPPATVLLTTTVLSREVGAYESKLPVQVPLNTPIRYNRTVHFPHLAVDITPVTNQSFHAFIQATNYKPAVEHNFLRHWKDGKYPAGKENHPVVWVDISDARAYCAWAGKRLPTEEEWQFIAQGFEGNLYPWGKDFDEQRCHASGTDTADVFAFPNGKSPFGCLDMCGNTWELTESEYADEHNRFCMLKGGSYFKAASSSWYTQGGPQPSTTSVKFLMLYPGLDRSATIGFRCVRDLG